jgi:hypothetical protein
VVHGVQANIMLASVGVARVASRIWESVEDKHVDV